MNFNRILSALSLILTIAVVTWMWISGQGLPSVLDKPSAENTTPDFVITQVSSQQFDEQGQLKYTLRAKALEHYPSGISHLTLPQLEFNDTNQSVWKISALTGEVNDLTHQAALNQQVLLRQPHAKTGQHWQLTTEHLSIDLDHSLVETDQPVRIKHSLGLLEAQGMRSNLATHQIDLLAQVRGHYAPQ